MKEKRMSNPRLLVDLDKIVHNTRQTKAIGRAHGLEVMGVTKGAAGLPRVARAMLAGGIESLGDSRLDNIERLRKAGIKAPITLLRAPGLSDIDRTVELADASLNADLEAIAALSDAARAQNRVHHVILMVDLETGREGFAAEETLQAYREVASLPGVRLAGLGAYFHLASGAGLHTRALSQLVALANRIETGLGKPLALLSGGSSNIFRTLAVEGHPNPGINHVRIGTAILLGFSSSLNPVTIDGFERDTFVLVAEVIEVKNRRPGEAILALGKVDTDPQFLFPLTPGLTVKDATSDHLLISTENRVRLGDWVPFHLGYPALCRLTASPYVRIEYVSESGSC
jgi:predicted amino acid racemase